MRHLRYLELSGNPLAEETGYRLLVIKTLPWLETLDMHKVGMAWHVRFTWPRLVYARCLKLWQSHGASRGCHRTTRSDDVCLPCNPKMKSLVPLLFSSTETPQQIDLQKGGASGGVRTRRQTRGSLVSRISLDQFSTKYPGANVPPHAVFDPIK